MVKLWRTRMKSLILNLILFGAGVTTCLMFVQLGRNEIDSPLVYTNPQEYQPPQQLLQTQQDPPCDTTSGSGVNKRVGVNNNNPNIPNNLKNPSYYEELNHIQPSKSRNKRVLTLKSSSPEILRTKDNLEESTKDKDLELELNPDTNGPTVWVVTPTFYRPEQKPELTRMAQALIPVSHFIYWILVDDVTHGSDLSAKELDRFMTRFSQIRYTVLKSFPPQSNTKIVGRPRGVGGRRAALEWLRKHYEDKKLKRSGVVYFADDDNTYDSDIFRQMQTTQKVSMWPVGLVTDFGVSSPIVQNGKVVGFYDGWSGLRKFPVDMAGFAINIQLFLNKPHANMPWVAGYEEDGLLKNLGITIRDITPLANNCTEILVWHTKAVRNAWPKRPKTMKPGLVTSTNLLQLLNSLPQKSLAGPGASLNKGDSGFSFLNLIFGGGL